MKNVQVNGKTYQPHELFEVVEEILPYDGPHDSVSIVVATEVLAHTARQLANATQSPNLLGDTSDMYHVAANLSTSMRSLNQVLEQAQRALEVAGRDGGLRDRDVPDNEAAGSRLAFSAEQALMKAQRSVFQAHAHLMDAWSRIGQLTQPLEEAPDGT